MIGGMVGVLHDEDVGDEHKKEWCANETKVTTDIFTAKKDLIAKTETEISEQEDIVNQTTAEIKMLTEKIAMLDKMVHDATAQRKAEHQEFVDMFATSATAIRLIQKAITRLEKFYSPEKYAAEKKAAEDKALKASGLALLHKSAEARKKAILVQQKSMELLPGGFDAFVQTSSHTETS